ncbi:translation initiation factor IF-2-like [Schistocerca gregaria]|uniref:translation initiation factor IF-2-like n=1 Tax=Schistocerca gregaria TaxID=7010 RepID=UPI00211E3437|nr:translation initiation factor IF-2-like [Schistocerca gregaria]
MDLVDTAPETLKTALSVPLPDSEDENSTAPQPHGRSGKQKRRATAATSAVRSSPIEKRAKQDFAPDADGFVPPLRTARRMQSSTTLPTAVANSFDALADSPDQLPRDPAPKKDSHLPPVVLQFRPPYGELQKLLRSWTTAVYTVKPAGRDLYRGCEVWKRAIARQRGQTPAPHPKKPATRRPGVSFAAATSGAPSAVPAASAAPAPAASDAVPIPEAPAPPPQLLVADPGTASPGPSARPRPANRLRGGQRPVGTQRSAPSVEQPQVDSPSESATPPPSSDGAAPAASTADLANLVAQLSALRTVVRNCDTAVEGTCLGARRHLLGIWLRRCNHPGSSGSSSGSSGPQQALTGPQRNPIIAATASCPCHPNEVLYDGGAGKTPRKDTARRAGPPSLRSCLA